MPLYEYRCQPCGHTFEGHAPMAESDKPRPCPRCATLAPKIPSRFNSPLCTGFAGTEMESERYGFDKREVDVARRELADFQHCIGDDGTVRFSNRAEQAKFADAFETKFPNPEVARKKRRAEAKVRLAGKQKKREAFRAEMRKAAGLSPTATPRLKLAK